MKMWWKMLMIPVMMLTIMNMTEKKTMMTISLNHTQSKIEMTMISDMMSNMFTMTVLIITMMIAMFSMSYMSEEKSNPRFIWLMTLFMLSMMMLINTLNLISMMLGWDGLGLTSYLLVIFYQNKKTLNSGFITILSNRIGDCMMILAISIMMTNKMAKSSTSWMTMMMMMTMMACMTKSAQAPFSAWLPEAMAAPTPVSSLVHSSTLVTAGIYLILRYFPLLSNKMGNLLLMTTALITTILAGMTAWKEKDSKKIVAMSTLSQLGLMAFTLATNSWKLCLFHMTTHALFKALLFINTGYNMTAQFSEQEKRKMKMKNSMITTPMMTANLSLMGIPYLAGFYSKDLIIESSFSKEMNIPALTLFIASCTLTFIYSFKLMSSITNNKKNIETTTSKKKDNTTMMTTTNLSILSISSGAWISSKIPFQVVKTSWLVKKMIIIMIIMFLVMKTKKEKKMNQATSKMTMLSKITSQHFSMMETFPYSQNKQESMHNLKPVNLVLYNVFKTSSESWKTTKTKLMFAIMSTMILSFVATNT